MKMDAQYFSFGSSLEDDALAKVESYVKSAHETAGIDGGDVPGQVTNQIQQQHKNHSIVGTLIITACCKHKNVAMLEPFVLDVKKAVDVWNSNVGQKDQIDTSNPQLLNGKTSTANSKTKTTMSVLAGAAYGSSFVGMVHILNADSIAPVKEEEMISLNEKLRLGGWLSNATGGIGVDPTVLKDVQQVLSTRQVSSHMSIINHGSYPSVFRE